MLLFMHSLVYSKMNVVYQLIMLVLLTMALYCFLIGDPMWNFPEGKGRILQESVPDVAFDTIFSYNMLAPY